MPDYESCGAEKADACDGASDGNCCPVSTDSTAKCEAAPKHFTAMTVLVQQDQISKNIATIKYREYTPTH